MMLCANIENHRASGMIVIEDVMPLRCDPSAVLYGAALVICGRWQHTRHCTCLSIRATGKLGAKNLIGIAGCVR
jgi:hypothetical protein